MTATNCQYWQGEGCIALIYGIKCSYATENFVPQCTATNNDLIEVDGE